MKKWTVRLFGGLIALLLGALLVLLIPFLSSLEDQKSDITNGSEVISTALGDVEYAVAGHGVGLLRLHGSPGGYDTAIASPRARPQDFEHFQVIAPSRPGYLRTPLSSGKTPAQQADLYAALLDTLAIKKAVVYGVSGGGPSAVQFAIRHPERIQALVLVAPLLKSKPLSENRMRTGLGGFLTEFGWWLGGKVMAHGLAPGAMEGFDANDPFEAEAMQIAVKSFLFGNLRKMGRDNDIDQWLNLGIELWPLEKITVPTLIVHGTADTDAPYEGSVKATARIPNAKLVTIEGGDHLIIVSRAKEIFDHVQGFAKAHSEMGGAN